MDKVSIVLPTYNGARYLRESIRSCFEQTYPEVELIVVDDCSTDETPDLLRSYAGDPRVKVVRHATNSKLPAALNTGFAHASGSLLTWTSDDNRFTPDAIEKLVSFLETRPSAAFVYSDYWLIDEDGRVERRVQAGPPEHLRSACRIASFLYRREVYRAVGDYDPRMFRIEDYDYWLRVAQRFELAWLPEPLYFYRRHAASLTRSESLESRAYWFDYLHTRYFGPDSSRYRRVLAQFHIAEAFERHLRGDRAGVLRHATRAVRRELSLLRNRGVISICAQALFGPRVTRVVRRALRREYARISPAYLPGVVAVLADLLQIV